MMKRNEFLKSVLTGAAGCIAASCCAGLLEAETKPSDDPAPCDGAFLRGWLTEFIGKEEGHLDRYALIRLMEERGRACCRGLEFRQRMIKESKGDVNRLVELMGAVVGPENSRREGNTVVLIYPVKQCVCGWNPKRAPSADDPYCDCSKANNQFIFETVSGKPVRVEVAESVRRGGQQCRFIIRLG